MADDGRRRDHGKRTGRLRPRRPPVPAAALVPVYRSRDGAVRLILVRRTDWGIHGGQLAFPGGKQDPGDASLLETALREAREEIGLPGASVTLLEERPPLETLTTGFIIHPFLARIVPPARWTADPREVAEVLDVTVADLVRPEAQGEETLTFPTWPGPVLVPFTRIGPHKLWGATYRILKPLLPRLLAGEWVL